ncbi:MAG: hypothetical protein ACOCTL_03060 [Candidatus Hadarchaeota archaeon]
MAGKEQCPKCNKFYLVYDPAKRVARCQRSVCDFSERVNSELDYQSKFG